MSPAEPALTAALLTISSSRAAQGGADQGGEALQLFAAELGLEVVARETLTDDRALIAERLRALSDELGVRLILTTGGTGFTGNDLTPEATADVINRFPTRFLFGTDTVAPKSQDQYLEPYHDYAPLLPELTQKSKRLLFKGNYERIFDKARKDVRKWEKTNVVKSDKSR